LRNESNFVVAFVHGWRHDASIGDTNVRDARHYGAHVARFLADRCEKYKQIEFCGVTVTVVYIGWRGARVDERKLQQHFGVVGEWIGTMAAIPTLFDRKPISEEVGPSTVTALRQLYNSMPEGRLKKMIVFGHSLGGNLLISTLKDYMVKMVGRHQSGRWIDDKPSLADLIKSPIGNLVVLINPASEAANWTAIQRAVWNRVPYRESESILGSTVDDGHLFFRQDQPPVLISVTAARSWPPSGLRPDDCAWLFHYDPNEPKWVTDEKAKMRPLVEKRTDMFKDGVEYDRATYDLFPLFKFDLRPVAQSLDRFAKRLAEGDKIRSACATPAEPGFWTISSRLGWLASVLRNMPFMNTDREQTRTVGHLDPPRPPWAIQSIRQFYHLDR
jgi:hypothetical protein